MATAKSPGTELDERHVLLLIIAVGALLRLPGIWQFECGRTRSTPVYEARDLIHSPSGPGGMELRPLCFLALHPIAAAMPHALALMRLPSLLFGLLGIGARGVSSTGAWGGTQQLSLPAS